MASSAAEIVNVPLSMFKSCSALIASFTSAVMFKVRSRMVRLASPSVSVVAPDLMPFLPLALTFSVPLPQSVTFEPFLHLMTAFSALVLSV